MGSERLCFPCTQGGGEPAPFMMEGNRVTRGLRVSSGSLLDPQGKDIDTSLLPGPWCPWTRWNKPSLHTQEA